MYSVVWGWREREKGREGLEGIKGGADTEVEREGGGRFLMTPGMHTLPGYSLMSGTIISGLRERDRGKEREGWRERERETPATHTLPWMLSNEQHNNLWSYPGDLDILVCVWIHSQLIQTIPVPTSGAGGVPN